MYQKIQVIQQSQQEKQVQRYAVLEHPLPSKEHMEHKTNGKCICEACSCGKHKCPDPIKKGDFHSSYEQNYPKHDGFKPEGKYKLIHKNFILPEDRFYGQSSYTGSYNQKNGTPTKNNGKIVHKGEISLGNDKFQAHSSYIDDFAGRGKPQRAERVPLPKNQILPEGRFQGDSSYSANYLLSRPERVKKFVPESQLRVGQGHFQGNSSYGADYASRGAGQRADRIPLPKNHVMPEGKFEGDSSYSANYLSSKAQKTKKFVPESQLKVGQGQFQGNSSYGADYAARGAAQRADRIPLPKNHVMPEGKFEGDSLYHASYIPGRAEKLKQFKPENQLKLGGSFEGVSSYGASYENKGQPLRAERVPLPRNQVMPEGKFEGDSSYSANYLSSKAQKIKKFTPQSELKVGGGHFQGNSSYGADYASRGAGQRADRIPLPKNHVMPEGAFEGASSYSGNYVPSKIEPSKKFKPEGQLKVGGQKFVGGSNYTIDYDSKGKAIRSERVPLPKNHVMPEGRFEGDSTYHGNYLQNKFERPAQFKPKPELEVGGKFQGSSSYAENYRNQERKILQKCPADELSAPRYQTSEKQHIRYNEQLHKWE